MARKARKEGNAMNNNYLNVKIENNGRIIEVVNGATIMAYYDGATIAPCLNFSFNNAYTVKYNKKSISTNNIEFFEYAAKHFCFDTLFSYVYLNGGQGLNYAAAANMTISAFYNHFNDDLAAFIAFFEDCTSSTRQIIIADHITYNHESKMDGVISFSTYVGDNPFCQARCNNCNNAICKYCYADSLTKQREGLKNKLRRNTAIFTAVRLAAEDIPIIDNTMYPFFRFESFGDLNNTIQVNNYNLMAAVNPGFFTLWTKNPGIIQAAINDGMIKADNLIIGLSSLYLNTPELEKAHKYSFVRFLFTVYDDEYIAAHNIVINCGAKHCITCGLCYKALHENKNGRLAIINERKK